MATETATQDLEEQLEEAQANTQAVLNVVQSLESARSVEEVVRNALDAVRSAFGWAYGSFWKVDPERNCLRFELESGSVNPEFRRVTEEASFDRGVGLSGRAWMQRDLVFVPDLGGVSDCCRAPVAQRAGVKSGVCFPVLLENDVIGTMDFFALETLELSEARLETLRSVGQLVSAAVGRQKTSERQSRLESAIQSSTAALMICNSDFEISYMNPSAEAIFRRNSADLAARFPGFSVDRLIGTNIDIFHRDPQHQRSLLSNPANLPASSEIQLGDLYFSVNATAVVDQFGNWAGNCVEWKDLTQQRRAEIKIAELIESASSGDLDSRLELEGLTGFLLSLGQGINQLIDSIVTPLRSAATVIEALAKGDLTESMHGEFEGEFAVLKQSVNTCVTNLKQMVTDVISSAGSLAEASSNISQGNTDLSQRTEEQASSLEETASTMEEITGAVRQNAENARQADDLAEAARGQAEKGGDVVGSAVSAMSEINASSKKIEDIIGVIDEIAFQTNLLALNAAVEAARAGEQGRGFAVVANEVRNLAQRSAGAAKEIKALIKDSVGKVEEGTRLVDASGHTLTEILEAVGKVSTIISEIASASSEQTRGIEQINKAVTQLDEMTQQNAALVEEAAAASESLDEQTHNLNQLMTFFSLGDEQPGPARSRSVSAASYSTPKRAQKSAASHASTSGESDEWEEF